MSSGLVDRTPSANSPTGKIAIAGASGAIGRRLVPYLVRNGWQPVLLGRDPNRLTAMFPDCPAADYEYASSLINGASALVNLAAINNDVSANEAEFFAINRDLVSDLYRAAAQAEVPRFIQLSTFRAEDPNHGDVYGRSKRAADEWLCDQTGPLIRILRLPAVQDDKLAGRLGPFQRLPGPLRPTAVIAALRAEVHIDRALEAIAEMAQAEFGGIGVQIRAIADPKDQSPLFMAAKRMVDWLFVIGVIVVLGWLMAIVWAAIRLSTPGPGILAQPRVGLHRKVFVCYKFRTMHTGVRQAGTHEMTQDSVTPIGRWLRRTKLDELPQIVNLICGEMTLIGPRPCLPQQTELIEARELSGVYDIVPGITGWSQIRDIDMSDPERLASSDAEYKVRRCLMLDARIMVRTIFGSGLGDRTRD